MSLLSLLRPLSRGLYRLTHRAQADRDVDDEVRHYADQLTREFVRNGLSADDARRAAMQQIGSFTVVREHVSSSGWEHGFETVLSDIHYAFRHLRHNPGFAFVSIATLALGIGATTAIFSAVNPILFRPLPYPDADRIVTLSDRGDNGSTYDPTHGTYQEIAARARSFASIAATDRWAPSLTGTSDPERLEGLLVTASYFRTIGVMPAIGRAFDESESSAGGPNVVVLSDRLVRRRFAGDASVIGTTIMLNGDAYRVIGVMPPGFVDVGKPSADLWAPMHARAVAPFNSVEWGHHYRILGRLAPTATIDQTSRELASIAHTPVSEFVRPVWANLRNGVVVRSMQDDITSGIRPALLAILAAVSLLLVIACVNVTGLLLARGAQRRGEFAMRTALGAERGRLLRQLLTESVILAGVGGAFGLLVAATGIRGLIALAPPGLPRVDAIAFNGSVFMFALVVTAFVGVLIGLVPAIAATRASLHEGTQGLARRTAGGRSGARNLLVVAEVSLAIVLLVAAGLLTRSLDRLFGVAPGFDPSHLVTMQVVEAGHAYDKDTARAQFFAAAFQQVHTVPGVVDAAFTSQLPLATHMNDSYGCESERERVARPNDNGATGAYRYAVSADYFRTMRINLLAGRFLDATDRAGTPTVTVISESFARSKFGRDVRRAVGERIRCGPQVSMNQWSTIVGVVGDVKQESLGDGQAPAFYVSATQWPWVDNVQSLVVRASGDAAALVPAIKRAVWSVDRNQPIEHVATVDRLIATSAAERRFASMLFQSFAFTALVLAAIGMYGVIAGRVAERTREIGIRTALGATGGRIVAEVIGSGLLLTTVGVAFGIAGAYAASRMLETLLFGVTRGDLVTYVGVIALLAGVSVLACWSPARRAAGVDPAITLRAE